ncbi:MAG: peptide chain release factor 1 [Candidatus Aenigmatarchaeota archaeon]|nr:MAG: peptide chain release factor 1 [Candidatus Aenigmarchaeota archaeon]
MKDSESKYKLKKLVEELKSVRGRHTELVTVYIPKGYNIVDIINQLKKEQGTAENIKSKQTRKNVISALEKIIQHLKLYNKTPENGLAVFAGNVSEREGQTNIKIWAIEPPEPVHVKYYWCDQRFETEPLEEMLKEKEMYGLLVLDKNEANFGILKGKRLEVLKNLDSIVPGKTRAGGQSAQRFERVREGMLQSFLKEVGETAKEVFQEYDIKGIIIGGPGPIKEEFVAGDYLPTDLKKKMIAVKDIGYTGEYGLEELLQRSEDVLQEEEVGKEKKLVQEFLNRLQKGERVAYGINEVKRAVDIGAAEIILISEDLEWKEVEVLCSCGWSGKMFVKKGGEVKCPKCDGEPQVVGERDVFEAFEEYVKNSGGTLEVISRDTKEGEQLYLMGGIAALLRYDMDK